MNLAVSILMLSAGLCSWTLADDTPVAAQPAAPQAPTAQVAAAKSPDGTVNATTASKPASAAVVSAEVNKDKVVNVASTESLIKKMRARGYKPVNRNGVLVFCRSEGELGSHFERTRCSTLDQLKDAERTGQEYTNQIQQQGSPGVCKGCAP